MRQLYGQFSKFHVCFIFMWLLFSIHLYFKKIILVTIFYTTYTYDTTIRSVFKISCLFLRPRPWQFEF